MYCEREKYKKNGLRIALHKSNLEREVARVQDLQEDYRALKKLNFEFSHRSWQAYIDTVAIDTIGIAISLKKRAQLLTMIHKINIFYFYSSEQKVLNVLKKHEGHTFVIKIIDSVPYFDNTTKSLKTTIAVYLNGKKNNAVLFANNPRNLQSLPGLVLKKDRNTIMFENFNSTDDFLSLYRAQPLSFLATM